MVKPYEQDVILDVAGQPIYDAMAIVQQRIDTFSKTLRTMGKSTVDDVKQIQTIVDANIKALKQARSDLKALQQEKVDRTAGFKAAEKQAKSVAKVELQADRDARRQGLIESRVFYTEKEKARKETQRRALSEELDGAKIVANVNRQAAERDKKDDRDRVQSAKQVAAARREAAQAAVTSKARGVINVNDAYVIKADSDARLAQLRKERLAVASNDSEAAKGIAARIQLEKTLGREIDGVIRKLNTQERIATGRLENIGIKESKLLIPGNVREDVATAGGNSAAVLARYRAEQEAARASVLAARDSATATEAQRVAAARRLELANANVIAAQKLVRLDEASAVTEKRLASGDRTNQYRQKVDLAARYAREQIGALGPAEALRRAKEATLLAEERLNRATGEQIALARQELALARARQGQVQRQQPATPQASPLSQILSPGYAAAAFARTGIYGAAAGAAYGTFNAVTGSVGEVVQMEDELAKLQAIASATDPQLQRMAGSIYSIGTNARFAATDLAKVAQTLAQAGVNAGQMEEVLGAVTRLATASGSTPDESVQLVTSAIGSFQLQASESARVADLMTAALNRTKLSVAQTGQAIQYVGATAFEQNISLEQLLATVGAIAQAGVRSGSTIGTGFRQFLVDLQSPSAKLTEQLNALKLTSADVDVSVRGLPAVLETLSKAGFGSGQAYAALETRAAAFYLVAKNNVEIMDQLQLAFATSGASAVANERAMNSLTAQYQRFKNILMEGFAESLEPTLNIFKNLLMSISDRITESRRVAEELRQKQKDGNVGFMDYNIAPAAEEALKTSLNALDKFFTSTEDRAGRAIFKNELLGDGLDNLAKKTDGTTAASERLETQVSDTTSALEGQTGKIGELDKEIERLILQKSSLRENDLRSSAEIATLTARFQGLAVYLTNTGNRYDDLTNAVKRYRDAQLGILNLDLTAQRSALALQTGEEQQRARTQGAAIQSDRRFGTLRADEQNAIKVLSRGENPNTATGQNAMALVASAVSRLANSDPRDGAQDLDFSRKINGLVQALGVVSTNVSQVAANLAQAADVRFQRTEAGKAIGSDIRDVNTLITQLRSADKEDQGPLGKQAMAKIDAVDRLITKLLSNPAIAGSDYRKNLENARGDLPGLRNQIEASLAPTKAELKEAKAAERAAKAAEREANKRPMVTQADLDNIIKSIAGDNTRLGSGSRTPQEQENLYAGGFTKARGVGSKVSDHVGNAARDIPTRGWTEDRIQRVAAALRARFAQEGIEAQVIVERGKANGGIGTGPHIHTGVRKGARLGKDRSGQSDDKYEASLRDAQVALDKEDLKTQLTAIAKSTTKETFDAATASAKAALDKVNAGLKTSAQQELAVAGFVEGMPQYDSKMAQVQQEIDQNVADYRQRLTDGLIKGITEQLKVAETAFNQAMQPARTALQVAQSQSEGLNAFSLRNKVPDYVRSLADNRVAMAQERVQKAEYNGMPAQIAAQENAIAATRASLSNPDANADQINAQLATMNVELEKLRANREALGAALGAGGLIPQTLGEGLQQAVEAYRQANTLNATFADELRMNLGGALETIHGGLTEMFSSIISGSQSALGAFATFAKGIMSWLTQMAAKALATQVFNMILQAVGLGVGATGGSSSSWGGSGPTASLAPAGTYTTFKGGLLDSSSPYSGEVQHYNGGGAVNNGDAQRDSVRAKLAKGEWVVQKKSVDSVGNKFMAQLNQHGSKALESLGSVPSIDMKNHTETNVYVVPPEQKPSMGPNDVLVLMQDEMLNGDSKRLIQHIARES